MEREMWQVQVETTEKGFICISQKEAFMEQDSEIIIHPDQADLLIQWIKDAKDELQKR